MACLGGRGGDRARRGWYPQGAELVLPGVDGVIILTAFGAILTTVEPLILAQGIEDVAVRVR